MLNRVRIKKEKKNYYSNTSIFQKVFYKFEKRFEYFFFILYKSLLYIILSIALLLFKFNKNIICLFVLLYIVYIFSIINWKTIFVNLYCRTFIWVFDNIFVISTIYRKRFDTINFNILFNMLRSIINLYIFVFEYFFLLNFRNIIVIALLNWVDYIFFYKYFSNKNVFASIYYQ